MADIAGDVAVNPDASAAVTDFLDYTEYLPADLIRSLTLIRGLDETYLQNAQAVDELTKVYTSLPTSRSHTRQNAQQLRSQVSAHLDQALSARESAYAEACRLFDLTDRHQNRLKSIIAKLNALPKPPSRDPTPQPQPLSASKRSRTSRKIENSLGGTRLTLKPPKGPAISLLSRPKHRRVTVPGEVLPPYDPDEPIASTEVSDWESDRAPSPPMRPILKFKQKPPRSAAEPVERKPRETATYRKPTPPPDDAELGGKYRPWTHLTEYEMYRLRKKMKKNHTWEPSEVMIRRDLAEKGRGWENYYKAKADALANGTKFIDIGDVERFQTGELVKSETPKTTPAVAVTPTTSSAKPRPAKRGETKKEKKDEVAPSKASLAAQETEQAARRLGNLGSAFKNLFSPVSNAVSNAFPSMNRTTSTTSVNQASKKPLADRSQKKRKLDESETSRSPSAEPETAKKKPKITIPVLTNTSVPSVQPISAGTIKIPLKLNITTQRSKSRSHSSTTSTSASGSTSRATSVHRDSVAEDPEPSPITRSRPSSRHSTITSIESMPPTARASRRASMTPAAAATTTMMTTPAATVSSSTAATTSVLRKESTAEPAPKPIQPTAASRRSKRDAPGTVTQSSQDGGAAVSISNRKAKPKAQKAITTSSASNTPGTLTPAQQKTATDASALQIRIDVDGNQEIVDPNEERYCICGDVSWGEMICCELDEKCEYGQWFHMDCINLLEHPPRTTKWYCPGDRKKYHQGEHNNGLVGRGMK